MTEFEQLDIYGNRLPMRAWHASNGRLTNVSTRLTKQQHQQVKFEASRRECSVSSIVREAVVEWLLRYGRTA